MVVVAVLISQVEKKAMMSDLSSMMHRRPYKPFFTIKQLAQLSQHSGGVYNQRMSAMSIANSVRQADALVKKDPDHLVKYTYPDGEVTMLPARQWMAFAKALKM